ncbi:hypothetical protein NLI96_g8662 [Meripilus lineatus]|uniref:Uncharacterized protein n=1 Tax=Meripilus lineatus TaxID=2056292 RepID=A0AAD5UWY0_9APHY|nr:hypothetical protein NLI96_g8662 [Physisporinus lineatus]
MGWFSSKKDPEPEPALRQDRQKCWESRDAYFACLDTSGVLKAGDEGTACASAKGQYERNCAKSWVDYFNKRRILAEQQKGVLAQLANQSAETKK